MLRHDYEKSTRLILAALSRYDAVEQGKAGLIGGAYADLDCEADASLDVIGEELDELGEEGVARMVRHLSDQRAALRAALADVLDGLPFGPGMSEYELVQAGCDPTEAKRLSAAYAALSKVHNERGEG